MSGGGEGVPKLAVVLSDLRRLGCVVQYRRRTGELFVRIPGDGKPICCSVRRKDATRQLIIVLRRLRAREEKSGRLTRRAA